MQLRDRSLRIEAKSRVIILDVIVSKKARVACYVKSGLCQSIPCCVSGPSCLDSCTYRSGPVLATLMGSRKCVRQELKVAEKMTLPSALAWPKRSSRS